MFKLKGSNSRIRKLPLALDEIDAGIGDDLAMSALDINLMYLKC